MGFNSAFKGLKLLKNPGNGRLNNLNDPVPSSMCLALFAPSLTSTQPLAVLFRIFISWFAIKLSQNSATVATPSYMYEVLYEPPTAADKRVWLPHIHTYIYSYLDS